MSDINYMFQKILKSNNIQTRLKIWKDHFEFQRDYNGSPVYYEDGRCHSTCRWLNHGISKENGVRLLSHIGNIMYGIHTLIKSPMDLSHRVKWVRNQIVRDEH
jgi:hypothetical protein